MQVEQHAESLKQCLQASFRLSKFQKVGSHSRGTAIRSTSDLDVFALLARDEVRRGGTFVSSDSVLTRVRSGLSTRYQHTAVGRDSQVIRVDFGQGRYGVDVIPAFYAGPRDDDGWPMYYIPDGNGGWMPTSPPVHNKYLKEANSRARGKLRYTSQLVKFWRATRSPVIPISSFHLEMLLADEEICVGPKSYAQCLFEAFSLLEQRACAGLRDPEGVSGVIQCAGTTAKRATALNAVRHAVEHAGRALDAEEDGPLPEAYRQWDIVFNGHFPKHRTASAV
jgi:hypothetical protein